MISIIVPVYNAEQYLSATLSSVLKQSYTDFELILVDDGSSDGSYDLCCSFAATDDRIRVMHTSNHGACMARNIGLMHAHGELLTFIDADDIVVPDYLLNLYQDYQKAPNVDLVIQGLIQKWPDKDDKIFKLKDNIYNIKANAGINFFNEVYLNDFSGPYCKLYLRSIIVDNDIKFSTDIIYAEDFDFLLRYLMFTSVIVTSSRLGYHYIMRSGTVSSKIYSFEKELSGLKQIFTSFQSISAKHDAIHLRKIMEDSINPYIWRVIYANYRSNYSKSQRIENLNVIPLNILLFFNNTYSPPTIFTKLVKMLICMRRTSLLDKLLSYRFLSKDLRK